MHLAHAGDAFLQFRVDVADLPARAAEGFARLAAKPDRGQCHQRHHGETEQAVEEVGAQHDPRNPDNQEAAADHLNQCEADGLLDDVAVVGDAAHEVAALVLGVEAQRQPLQMIEKVTAQRRQHFLPRPTHHEKHEAAGNGAEDVETHQDQRKPPEPAQEIRGGRVGRQGVEPAVGLGCGRLGRRGRICGCGGRVDGQVGHTRREVAVDRLAEQFRRDDLHPGVADHQHKCDDEHQPVGRKVAAETTQRRRHAFGFQGFLFQKPTRTTDHANFSRRLQSGMVVGQAAVVATASSTSWLR